MKIKSLSAALVLLAIQTAAYADQNKPAACPSIDALKRTGVSAIMHESGPIRESMMGVEVHNRFDTNDDWTLMVMGSEDKFKSEVLAKANAALSSVKSVSTAYQPYPNLPYWVCNYKDGDGNATAVAITPSMYLGFSAHGYAAVNVADLMKK